MDKYTALRRWFGHTAFRPGQETLIDGILAGRDALGIMPTGGGKSLCYQVPALLLPGVTLVISPLISLMKDQVAALNSAGIPAAFLNSSLDSEGYFDTCDRLRRGAYKLLYVAPERLEQESFLRLAEELTIPLLAVDEAHCVSQWGQDFRPSYLRIPAFVSRLSRRPVVAAFTATATEEVREDIQRRLTLETPVTVVTGFDRPNLFFDVLRPKKKQPLLLSLVEERRGRSGIIYCATRRETEQVCQLLQEAGFPVTRYHAGLSEAERQANQDDFRLDRKPIMAATNAFGMGIDKSNVSYVIHYNMPKSLEAYYQEAGRAGRDGEAAECLLLYGPGDEATARFFISRTGENEALTPEEEAAVRAQDEKRLAAMTAYCKTTGCFRGKLLDYFGQSHRETCGNCGNCRREFTTADITRQAQMLLSCVLRIKNKLGYYVGVGLVTEVLRGSKSKRLLSLGLDSLSTYGLMKGTSGDRLQGYIEALQEAGYLYKEQQHNTLRVTGKAEEVLFQGARVTMRQRAPTKKETKAFLRPMTDENTSEEELQALEVLKTIRRQLAERESVPLYVIFSNATLTELARRRPRTRQELLTVSGIGEVKAQKYGPAFLKALESLEKAQAPEE